MKALPKFIQSSYQVKRVIQAYKSGVLNLFCLVYPFPKEKSIIYPQCTTTAFSLLKIKAFFSL